MHPLPQRLSLVSQTALILKQRIQSGEWREWLPGERALCETLQISRNTVRSALRQLEREGVTRALHGAGNRIRGRANPKAGALQSRDVGCLVPVPLEQLRPAQALWIDALRAMLNERDCRLHLFHEPQYFRAQPAAAYWQTVAR